MCTCTLWITFPHIRTLLSVIYLLIVLIVVGVVIHDKRDPVKSLSWITVIALLPFAGCMLYFIFGRNRRKEKIFNRKELRDQEQIEELTRQQIYEINNPALLHRSEIDHNRDIITLLLNSNKALLTVNNRIRVLHNGADTFAEILQALRVARSSIHLEYYIFEESPIGDEIAEILLERAAAGVEVRMIYDDVGSWGLSRRYLNRLKKGGVQVHCFMQVVFPWLTSTVNYRNHRKILVVDGKVGFTGGINIAQRYIDGTKLGIWRDTHLMLEGDSVNMLQTIFLTDWFFVSKELITAYPKYLPRTHLKEEHLVQIATSGPDSDWASIMQAFFAAITRAQHHIYISSPYFLPNEALLTAIKVAALSGIDVRVMIPRRGDSKIVYWASRSYISELIEANVKVYLYKKGFNHSKLIMIDGGFGSVGTANMDVRSFEDNFEVTAVIYDRKITKELEDQFLRDLNDCECVTAESWERRSNLHSFYEAIARLFSPLL